MTEISLLVIGYLLALLFFIWLAFGKKATSKTATLVIDTVLLALCVAAVLCGLLLRQEKYQSMRQQDSQPQAEAAGTVRRRKENRGKRGGVMYNRIQ